MVKSIKLSFAKNVRRLTHDTCIKLKESMPKRMTALINQIIITGYIVFNFLIVNLVVFYSFLSFK